MELNSEQQKVVSINAQETLVVAGAGTGKTRVVVERILHLLDSGVKPGSIAALTFTEKATAEMQDRLSEARGTLSTDITIATFNGFGDGVLREFAADVGLSSNVRLLSEVGQLVFLREHLDELELDYYAPVSRPDSQLEHLRTYFSAIKQQAISADDHAAAAAAMPSGDDAESLEKQKYMELSRAFSNYLSLCRKHNVIDYDDQLYLLLDLFKKRPNVLRTLQERYQHLLVDEFQDTNPLQSRIIDQLHTGPSLDPDKDSDLLGSRIERNSVRSRQSKVNGFSSETVLVQPRDSQVKRRDATLQRDSQEAKPEMSTRDDVSAAGPVIHHPGERSLMVVGDDDQSIYGWRGATLANILDFTARYSNADRLSLTTNYRSTQGILDAGYKLVQHNDPNRLEHTENISKKLVAARGNGDAPQHMQFASLNDELQWVCGDIAARISAGQDPGGIAILTRRRAQLERMHDVLQYNDIAHTTIGLSSDMYDQQSVIAVVEALRTSIDPSNNQALYHVLSGPLFMVNGTALAHLSSQAQSTHVPLLELCQQSDDAAIKTATSHIENWQAAAAQLSLRELAYKIVTDTGYSDTLFNEANDIDVQAQALGQWFDSLRDFAKAASQPSAVSYIASYEALRAAGTQLQDETLQLGGDTVQLLTIHKSKGLEWDVVYVIDCTEGSLPMRTRGSGISLPADLVTSSEADAHLAEERRLMYVAMTRAKNTLVLTSSDTHTGTTPRKPSRFIGEANVPGTTQNPPINGPAILPNVTSVQQQAALPANLYDGQNVLLSVSQVDAYMRCPQEFYYRYVLSAPQPPAPQLAIGTLIHDCIQQMHKARATGQPLPKLEDFKQRLRQSWPQDGYGSAAQRTRAMTHSLQASQTWYDAIASGPKASQVEAPFTLKFDGLHLRGRIDAVVETKEHTEIIDYKTGAGVRDDAAAKKRAQASNQLAMYALAWRELHGASPSKLTLHFVETNAIGSVKKQEKSLDSLTDKLKNIATAIAAHSFPPGRDHSFCSHPISRE